MILQGVKFLSLVMNYWILLVKDSRQQAFKYFTDIYNVFCNPFFVVLLQALGDCLESIAGAVLMDSKLSLDIVWQRELIEPKRLQKYSFVKLELTVLSMHYMISKSATLRKQKNFICSFQNNFSKKRVLAVGTPVITLALAKEKDLVLKNVVILDGSRLQKKTPGTQDIFHWPSLLA
ncbi:hypothetical protein MKW98_008402 [Papaver atlanticum]|uniref:Uncharacterized protein n=1 Tax=Papaver atlanticum TaxID=357466 RepID=A0AAD4SII0_9MAGN|nr:hypothetical protein MKW98_008402 [Papaver atlanticum]